jgi:hypothetical protein
MRGVEDKVLRLSVIGWVVVCGLLVVAACGGSGSPARMAKPPSTTKAGGGEVLPQTPKQQIEELEAKITADSSTLELPEPTEEQLLATPAQPLGTKPVTDDPKCKPANNDACKTSCTLTNSICSNADKICQLAIEMNDSWARGKCIKANRSCEDSKVKCCGCQ